MKELFLFVALLFPVVLFAQNTEGRIIYNETVQMEIKIQGDASGMEHKLPKEHTNLKSLTFNAEESIFEDASSDEAEETEMSGEHNGNNFQMKMVRPENILFKNVAEGQTVEQKEFFGKKFLIAADLKPYEWKLTGAQKTILDYNCQEAVTEDENGKKVVWFTSEIPVSNGPGFLGQLPGMILEANLNDGKMVLVANKVYIEEIPSGIIDKPTKGKPVTQEEYDEIVAKKMEEMGVEPGGNGRAVFRVIRQ